MRDVSVSFVNTALIQIINVATGILAARLLLPEGRGELAAIILWAGILAEFGNVGFYDAVLYRASTGALTPRALFAAISALSLGTAAILAGVAFLILPITLAGERPEVLTIALWFTAFYLPGYFGALLFGGLFQGYGAIQIWNFLRLLVPVGYLAAIILFWLTGASGVAGFAAASIAGHFLAVGVGLSLIVARGWFAPWPPKGAIRSVLDYGWRVYVADILQAVRTRIDQAMVALYLGPAELGLYVVALTLAQAPVIFANTITYIAFPRISGTADPQARAALFGRYLRLALATAIALNVALAILDDWLIPLLFGAPFAPAVAICDVLLLTLVPYFAKWMYLQGLKAWDRPLHASRAELVGLIVAATTLALLLPRYGAMGAAWALVLSNVTTASVGAFLFHRVSGARVGEILRPRGDDMRLALAILRFQR